MAAPHIRTEQPRDAAAIAQLVEAAFRAAPHADYTEHRIVAALRASGQLTLSLLAEDASGLIGHVALSSLRISDGSVGWYGLGPVSVAPARQRASTGTALVQAALTLLRGQGANGCVVLGDPHFYARFGFVADPALIFPGVPAEYFQRLHWQGARPAGEVRYAEAFYTAGGA
jgi:putative hydrolases of HD superfamily